LTLLTQIYGNNNHEIAFILGTDGTYLAHSDPQKIGALAANDFDAETLQTLSSGESGSLDNALDKQMFGYAAVPDQNAVMVIVKNNQAVSGMLDSLESSITLQLSVTLLITSIISGVAILTIVNPLRTLAVFADQVGSGNLDAVLNLPDVEGEIAVLANSLKDMASRLRDMIVTLESKVAERTRDLDVASEVSRQITRVLDMDVLLPQLVEQTRQGFNLYYVSLFLYDLQTQELHLEVETGAEGKHVRAEVRSFHIDARPSLVAQVAREGKAEIINDTANSPAHLRNLHLPDTRAEANFPMFVGDEIIGVLNLQSETVDRFQESDARIFSTLAEQIAIAVRNAQLYREQEHVALELERTDRMKTQFLASMSHELRTPLNAIINFTQMVALGMAGDVTDEQRDLLEQSTNSSKHLLHLINDVLDIGKIQAGKLSLFIEHDVNLYREIESAVGMLSNTALSKGVQLVNDIDDNLPIVSGDKRRIRQVILNLLSNAAKFTEQGTITLSAKLQDDKVVIAVIDTGPGIPETAQELIFEAYAQTEDGTKVEGTGLGLPISRSLAQAHGGDLWVESKVGDGAAFYFTLPAKGEKNNEYGN